MIAFIVCLLLCFCHLFEWTNSPVVVYCLLSWLELYKYIFVTITIMQIDPFIIVFDGEMG